MCKDKFLKIPSNSFERIPLYLSVLKNLESKNIKYISSSEVQSLKAYDPTDFTDGAFISAREVQLLKQYTLMTVRFSGMVSVSALNPSAAETE